MKPLISALLTTLGLSLGLVSANASKTLGASAAERGQVERQAAASSGQSTRTELRTTVTYESKKQSRLQELYDQARAAYDAGDIAEAHALFEEMLLIDPSNAAARTYLDNMQPQWEAYLEDKRVREELIVSEAQTVDLLQTPVTIETLRPTPLDQFLNNLSFATGMNFAIASGVEASISNAKFIDIPLEDVLDAVLLPIGLEWRVENGTVVVETALETRVFRFSRDEMTKVKTLYTSQTFQRVLWGPDARPDLAGETMVLDERDLALIVTDSRQRLDKMEALLTDLNAAIAPDLETRIYKIRETAGPEIRALIDAVITTAPATPFDLERRVYVDGEDLIIRETPERLAKIEALLADEGFMQKLVSDELDIRAFSLIPRTALEENREYMQAFANRVVEQVRTFLYTRIGVEQAEALGRRMWFDPNTLTLVIADTPDNLLEVGSFLDSLPELASEQRFAILYLRYVLAADIEGDIAVLMGIEGAEEGAAEELEIVKTLRREDEFTWRDATVVVRRINSGGDIADEFDDSAEIIVRIAGSRQSSLFTLNELDVSQYATDAQGGEYEFYAEDIKPTGNVGEGRVRLVLRYTPPESLGLF